MMRRIIFLLSLVFGLAVAASTVLAQPTATIMLTVTVGSANMPPAAPAGVTATAADTVVDLSWMANQEPDFAGYNVYRSQISGSGYVKVNSQLLTQNSYHDTGLTNGITYYYVVTAVDSNANESVYSVDQNAAPHCWITNVSDAPDAFSPNGDNNFDVSTIGYAINKNAIVTIAIYDAADTIVRTLKNAVSEIAGAYTVAWDGKNDSNVVLGDGVYRYSINADDGAGNLIQKQGSITLDNHCITFSEPVGGSTLSGEVIFRAIVSTNVRDAGNVLFYVREKGQTGGDVLDDGHPPVEQPDGSWIQTINSLSGALNTVYEFAASVDFLDLNNENRREYSLPMECAVQNEVTITHVKDSPDAFSPNSDGQWDSTAVEYTINMPAGVTVKIYDANNLLVRTLKENISEPMGKNTATWDGRDESNTVLADGIYRYEITAVDSLTNQTVTAQGTVSIDNHFMRIIEPAVNSEMVHDVFFGVVPSEYVRNARNVKLQYRVQATSQWNEMPGAPALEGDGAWHLSWNADILAAGIYEVRIYAGYDDLRGNPRDEYSLPAVFCVPEYVHITNVSDAPDAFSPNDDGDSEYVLISYEITENATVSISVYDANDVLANDLKNNASEAVGWHSVRWYGTDNNLANVPDGIYTYAIEATDNSGYVSKFQGTVAVDAHIVTIIPWGGTTLKGETEFVITYSPYVENGVGVTCYYREKDTVTWRNLVGESKIDNFHWSLLWDTAEILNGEYEMRWRVRFKDRNGTTRYGYTPVAVYFLNNDSSVFNISAYPEIFTPDDNGYFDFTDISYSLNTDASVTLTIYDTGNTPVRLLKNNVAESRGVNKARWDGKNDNGEMLGDGIYRYVIVMTDNAGQVSRGHGEVTLDNHYLVIEEPPAEASLNGTVTCRFRPSQYCANVQKIIFSQRNVVFNNGFVDAGEALRQSDNSWTYLWDTDNLYAGRVEIQAMVEYTDLSGEFHHEPIRAFYSVKGNKIIEYLHDSPDAFNPKNINAEKASISYSLSAESTVLLMIYDANNNLVRILLSEDMKEGRQWELWDGKNDQGGIVDDGLYTYVLEARHALGTVDREEGVIAIDAQIVKMIDPIPGSSVTGEVTFILLPSEYIAETQSVSLRIRKKTTGSFSGSYNAEKQAGNSWQCVVNTAALSNGDYEGDCTVRYLNRNNEFRWDDSQASYFTISNNLSVSRNAFSPNADGYNDTTTLYYTLADAGTATIAIKDEADTILKIIKNNLEESAGIHSIAWDGTDSAGGALSDGVYLYEIAINYGAGNDIQQGSIAIDNHFMKIIAPDTDTVLENKIELQAQASPYIHKISGVGGYYREEGTTSWQILYGFQANTSVWKWPWDTQQIKNGNYEVSVEAFYYDLNNVMRKELSLPQIYSVRNEFAMSEVSDSPDAFSPNGNGVDDTTQLSYFINDQAMVSIEIFDAAGITAIVLQDNAPEESGKHSVAWDGKNAAGDILPDGTYTYRITAGHDAIEQDVKEGAVSIDNNYLRIVSPVPGETLSGEVTFIIEPSLFVSKVTSIQLKAVSEDSIWKSFPVQLTSNGTYEVKVDTNLLQNGEWKVWLDTSYYDLNNTRRFESTTPVLFLMSNVVPDVSGLQAIPNPFSPDESGTWKNLATGEIFQAPAPGLVLDDEARISFTASDYGVFEVKIVDDAGVMVKHFSTVTLYPDAQTRNVELVWNGSYDGSSTKVKNGMYHVIVSPGSDEKEVRQDIIVDKIPYIKRTSVAPNPFNPVSVNYKEAVIKYEIAEDAFVDILIYSQDVLVRKLIENKFLERGFHAHAWEGKDDQGHLVTMGSYTVIINAHTEYAAQSAPEKIMLFVSGAMDVYTSSPTLNPYVGETVVIYYKLESQSDLTLNVYNDNNMLVRTMVNNELRESGFQTEIWDGKDTNGYILPDGFYYFTITSNVDGQTVWQYDPGNTDGADISGTMVLSISNFDAKNNVMCTLDLDIAEPVYVYTRIRPGRWEHDESEIIRLLKYHEPYSSGHARFYWDGRDESGDFVPHGSYFIGVWGYRADVNSMMVTGGTPRISIDRNSITPVRIRPYDNPYRSDPSDPDVSIAFGLSLDAFVTAKVYNDSGILVTSLLEDNLLVAGNQVLHWNARASDGKQLPKGYYRVMLQAHYGENYSEPVILHVELAW